MFVYTADWQHAVCCQKRMKHDLHKTILHFFTIAFTTLLIATDLKIESSNIKILYVLKRSRFFQKEIISFWFEWKPNIISRNSARR